MSLKFLSKKGFNPQNAKNRDAVHQKELRALEEVKKIEALRLQYARDREVEEQEGFAIEAGITKKQKKDALSWMYNDEIAQTLKVAELSNSKEDVSNNNNNNTTTTTLAEEKTENTKTAESNSNPKKEMIIGGLFLPNSNHPRSTTATILARDDPLYLIQQQRLQHMKIKQSKGIDSSSSSSSESHEKEKKKKKKNKNKKKKKKNLKEKKNI